MIHVVLRLEVAEDLILIQCGTDLALDLKRDLSAEYFGRESHDPAAAALFLGLVQNGIRE